MRSGFLAVGFAALVGCGGSSNNTSCGDGTVLVDGTCQMMCDSGTMLVGSACVPVGSGSASAPTIASIDPPEAGAFGGTPFKLTGTGFTADAQVFFGDVATPACQAVLASVASTEIDGTVPTFCGFNVTVSVVTAAGTATTPFHYDALFAAEGDADGSVAGVGSGQDTRVFLLDPTTDAFVDLGELANANDQAYGIDAWTFDATGQTLVAFTSGDSPADAVNQNLMTDANVSIEIKVDVATGTVTTVGNTLDAADSGHAYVMSDVKQVNGTLYGWAYGASSRGLVTIAADGLVTAVGTLAADPSNFDFLAGGMSLDATGAMNVAAEGAGSDSDTNIFATGELDTVNLSTGALTKTATLDWAPAAFGRTLGSPIAAMDLVAGKLYAVLDDGAVAAQGSNGAITGETLAVIDPAHAPFVTAVYALPSQVGFVAMIDAIATAPVATNVTTIFGKPISSLVWQH